MKFLKSLIVILVASSIAFSVSPAEAGIFKKTAQYLIAKQLIKTIEKGAKKNALKAADELLERMVKDPRLLHNVEEELLELAARNPKVAQTVTRILSGAKKAAPSERLHIPGNRYPSWGNHVDDAIEAGQPKTLTLARPVTKPNRKASTGKVPRKPGLDRDEYPFAATQEGGRGASVRHIDPRDNRGAGSCFGHWCKGKPDGTRFWVDTEDMP